MHIFDVPPSGSDYRIVYEIAKTFEKMVMLSNPLISFILKLPGLHRRSLM